MNLDTNQNVNAGKLFESDITIQHETRDLEGRPSITPISNVTEYFGLSTTLETNSFFDTSFSSNSGNIDCNYENISELPVGDHTISCIAVDNNGYKSSEATKEITITDQLGDIILLNESTSYNTLDSSISYIKNKLADSTTQATTDEGLYATADNFGTSYYYRGNVTDNWVYFAGFYWRIMSIDGYGNIKLIYSGTTKPITNTSVMTGTNTQIGTVNNYDTSIVLKDGYELIKSFESVGYVYSDGSIDGKTESGILKRKVDEWYNSYMKNYEKSLVKSSYCLDRDIYVNSEKITNNNYNDYSGDTWYGTGVNYTLSSKSYDFFNPASLQCSDNIDLYVGLSSIREIILSGYSSYDGIYNTATNTENYMHTGEYNWLVTGAWIIANNNNYVGKAWYVYYLTSGNGTKQGRGDYGLRPTISLKSDITITGGTGTGTDPYIIA